MVNVARGRIADSREGKRAPFNGKLPDSAIALLLHIHRRNVVAEFQRETNRVTGRAARSVNREHEFHGLACRNGQAHTREINHPLVYGIVLATTLPFYGRYAPGDRAVRDNAGLIGEFDFRNWFAAPDCPR